MTPVDDLVAWLTQIWDEQEKAARFEKELTDDVYADGEFTVEYQWARMTKHASGGYGSSFAKGAPSPTEVLARIAADRQILALHAQVTWQDNPKFGIDGGTYCAVCDRVNDPGHEWPCQTLRLLAQPYADRPGFRDEWRVTA